MLTQASLLIWISAAWIVATLIALTVVVPLCVAAKRADEADERARAEASLEIVLNRLSELSSPAGSRFFARPDSRRELADELRELLLHH